MPRLTSKFYAETGIEPYQHYIETGSYRGDGIQAVLNDYRTIDSIELTTHWAEHCQQRYLNYPQVKIHCGDTADLLAQVLDQYQQPVTVYLDAHYSGGSTGLGAVECPLLQELEILQSRPYPDIIIIDDCRLLGSHGTCGAGANDPIYPTMEYDWRSVTADSIVELLKPNYQILSNQNLEYTTGARDQILLIPNYKE